MDKVPQGDARAEVVAQVAREPVEKRDAWLNPPGASEAELKKRTLTNLYNELPPWLDLAHLLSRCRRWPIASSKRVAIKVE